MRISSVKIFSKCTSRFGSTLRIAQLALATTLSASLLHFNPRQSSTTLTFMPLLANVATSQLNAVSPTGATAKPPSRAALALPLGSRSTGTVSAAATTLFAPNAVASISSLPTPFCGVTKTHFSGRSTARRSVSIAPSVSYALVATIATSASYGVTASSSRGAYATLTPIDCSRSPR